MKTEQKNKATKHLKLAWDKTTKDTFLKAVKMGFSNQKACQYSKISQTTLYKYLQLAEEAEKKGITNDYTKFKEELDQARAQFMMRHVARITQASDNGTWQASAWLLERRMPEEFAPQFSANVNSVERIEFVDDVPEDDGDEE